MKIFSFSLTNNGIFLFLISSLLLSSCWGKYKRSVILPNSSAEPWAISITELMQIRPLIQVMNQDKHPLFPAVLSRCGRDLRRKKETKNALTFDLVYVAKIKTVKKLRTIINYLQSCCFSLSYSLLF